MYSTPLISTPLMLSMLKALLNFIVKSPLSSEPVTEKLALPSEATVKRLKSNFVTMDLARREDGSLIIMELGDGQVSGLQQIKASDFYRSFNSNVLRLERTSQSFGTPLPKS